MYYPWVWHSTNQPSPFATIADKFMCDLIPPLPEKHCKGRHCTFNHRPTGVANWFTNNTYRYTHTGIIFRLLFGLGLSRNDIIPGLLINKADTSPFTQ